MRWHPPVLPHSLLHPASAALLHSACVCIAQLLPSLSVILLPSSSVILSALLVLAWDPCAAEASLPPLLHIHLLGHGLAETHLARSVGLLPTSTWQGVLPVAPPSCSLPFLCKLKHSLKYNVQFHHQLTLPMGCGVLTKLVSPASSSTPHTRGKLSSSTCSKSVRTSR